MRWLDGITSAVHMNFSKLREIVKVREAQCAAWCDIGHGVAKNRTGLGS